MVEDGVYFLGDEEPYNFEKQGVPCSDPLRKKACHNARAEREEIFGGRESWRTQQESG